MGPRVSAAALWVLAACSVTPQAPSDAMLACSSHAECPSGWTCSVGRCVLQAKPCSDEAQCDDNLFCNGDEACVDGTCTVGTPPCVGGFDCVSSACGELGAGTGACSVTVDHLACDADEYCNPTAGCIPGQGCQVDADCQDAYACDGAERCINFVCAGGTPPAVDDSDTCTLDGCNDARVDEGLDPVFHIAQIPLDGSACAIPGTGEPGSSGVCVSAKGGCVASECGDGVTFTGASESCDDGAANNSNAWGSTRHCNATCSGWAPYCGDEQVDVPAELCDAGAANGGGAGCSATCQRDGACGDAIPQTLFEQCDDGDSDECNGCRTDCNFGCICSAPAACLTGTWCGEGLCAACDEPTHCGPSCIACPPATPVCEGVAGDCVCDPSPAPRGSCSPGTYCDAGGTCLGPCDSAERCGQECLTCGGDTPICGGVEVGCVVDPATHPGSRGCSGMPDFTPCRVASPTRSYNICIDGVCREPGCGTATCNVHGPSFARADLVSGWEYPDTNQRICYNATAPMGCATLPCASDGSPAFCGQDAQYGWDVTHPDSAARWTKTISDEPMVTDNVTGLVWQGCAGGLSGPACAVGGASAPGWTVALTYCDALSWGGYSDWRLPDYHELLSIVDAGRRNPSIDVGTFPNTPGDQFWSSSTKPATVGTDFTLSVHFGYGLANELNKGGGASARCVRSGPSGQPWGGAPRFERSEPVTDQAVVVDARTKLMWQGCAAGQVSTLAACTGSAPESGWQAALAYCEGLTWGGHTDWRLPNRVELTSIVDQRWYLPPVDPTIFPDTPPGGYWSSSPEAGNQQEVWRVGFDGGFVYSVGVGSDNHSRCVRPVP